MRVLLFVLFTILLPLLTYSAQTKAEALPDYCAQPLQLVHYGDWYPYLYVDQTGFNGVDWQFLNRILTQISCQVTVISIPEKRAHKDLNKHHSLVMIGATVTKERAKHAYFSDAYRNETMALFYFNHSFPANMPPTLKNAIDNSDIVAINGAAWYGEGVESLRKSRYKKKFIHVPGMAKRFEMLFKNRAQLLIEDRIAGCYYYHQSEQQSDHQGDPLHLHKIKTIDVNQVKVAFMFSRNVVSAQFLELFNQTMNELLEQGLYNQLMTHYIPDDC